MCPLMVRELTGEYELVAVRSAASCIINFQLDGQGRARREAARRRKSEWKVILGNGNSSRSNDS